jgi:hypothetical protein
MAYSSYAERGAEPKRGGGGEVTLIAGGGGLWQAARKRVARGRSTRRAARRVRAEMVMEWSDGGWLGREAGCPPGPGAGAASRRNAKDGARSY